MENVNNPEFFEVTLRCLSVPVLRIVSTLLNPTKYIPTKENLPRDWRGLAHLAGYNSEDVSLFERSPDPSFDIVKRLCERDCNTIKKFLLFLAKLDRFDVYDDIISFVVTDINNHKKKVKCSVDTSLFITLKDRETYQPGLPPIQYDACLLYADDDGKLAAEIVWKLEQEYKLSIFMKERDLVGGTIEHDATMKIIASRSNRLIIILSPAFLESSENKYFISFAQSIGIEQRQRKIIPCIYKDCDIPTELKPLYKLDYRRQSILYNFYDKLYMSIIPAGQAIIRPLAIVSSNSCPNTVKDTLTVPQISCKAIKEHVSLPELREQTKNGLIENNTDLGERSNSINSLASSTAMSRKPNFRWKGIKKIFKKKKEVALTS